MDDDHNEHKQMQLRELAAINGTLRDHELIEQQRALEGEAAAGVRALPRLHCGLCVLLKAELLAAACLNATVSSSSTMHLLQH